MRLEINLETNFRLENYITHANGIVREHTHYKPTLESIMVLGLTLPISRIVLLCILSLQTSRKNGRANLPRACRKSTIPLGNAESSEMTGNGGHEIFDELRILGQGDIILRVAFSTWRSFVLHKAVV